MIIESCNLHVVGRIVDRFETEKGHGGIRNDGPYAFSRDVRVVAEDDVYRVVETECVIKLTASLSCRVRVV